MKNIKQWVLITLAALIFIISIFVALKTMNEESKRNDNEIVQSPNTSFQISSATIK